MIFRLAIRNLLHRPLNFILSWVLLAASIGIMSLLLALQSQFEEQFNDNIRGTDMVIGAKGSPLQLILSAVYHVDAPTGNIKYKDAEKWMKHPYVERAIPLAYGDSFKGYSILGTTWEYLDQYNATLAQGRLYQKSFEVVIGAGIAERLHLKEGEQFFSTHGLEEHGHQHKNNPYTVTGILKPTGTIIDNLIVGDIESIWKIHAHAHEHEHGEEAHEEGEHESHDPEITAVLIKFRSPMGIVQLPRIINAQSNLMAALPSIELNRLFSLLGIGIDTLTLIMYGILMLAVFSIFITLFNSLKERRYELALMRSLGGSRQTLLFLLLLESLLLCVAGFVTGIILSKSALWILTQQLSTDFHFPISHNGWQTPGGPELAGITLLLGFAAAIIPACKAWNINISKTLSHDQNI